MSSPQEPALLCVSGGGADRLERARFVGCSALVLFVLGTLLIGGYAKTRVNLQWVPGGGFHALLVIGVVGSYLAERWVRPTTGIVVFRSDRIVFMKQRGSNSKRVDLHQESVLWIDVTGYKDDAAEFVAIVTKGGVSSLRTVPTLNEADRVAVLKLLDEKGVPRVE